jgi:hypothetical protein
MINLTKNRNSFLAGFLAMTSVLVFAGSYQDIKLKSLSFMDDSEVKYESAPSRNTLRVVASSENSRPRVQYLGVNEMNQARIEGEWEVIRMIDSKGEEVFNKNYREEDKNKFIKINLEMIGTSQVRLNDDHRQVFLISLLTEFNTIVLFKSIKEGYEIIEAKKLNVVNRVAPSTLASSVESNSVQAVATAPTETAQADSEIEDGTYAELILERALHPSVSDQVMTGDMISGNVVVTGGSIESFHVTLHRGSDKQLSLDFSFANINDGGQFEADFGEDKINGIITQNGENGYRIRFATGPLSGSVLNFLTADEFEKVQAQIEEDKFNKELNEQSDIVEEAVAVQQEAAQERSRANGEVNYNSGIFEVDQNYYQEDENYEREEEVTNPEVMSERIENGGFAF